MVDATYFQSKSVEANLMLIFVICASPGEFYSSVLHFGSFQILLSLDLLKIPPINVNRALT